MLPRVLRHRWFAAFTGAVGIVALGGEFQRLALPLLVLDATHSVAAAATLRVVQFLPHVLWGPFAGAIVDRLDRRRVLLTCDTGLVLTYGLLAVLTATPFQLWQIYALSFIAGAFDATWALVTDFSVVPSLVGGDELTQANSVYLGTDRGARAFGPALAGLVIGAFGAPIALAITALSSLATVAIVFVMPPRYRLEETLEPFRPRTLAAEIGEGFGYVLRHPILRSLIVLMFVANLGGAGVQTILLFHLREEVGLDAATIGFALSAVGLAAILGSASAPLIARGRPLGHTMVGVVVAAAAATAVAATVTEWRAVVGSVAGRVFAQSAHVVYAYLPRQREVPARLRGRANGAFRTMVIVGNSLSPAVLGALAERASASLAFGFASALMLLAAGITYFSPLRSYDIRPVTEEPPAAAEEIEAAAE